jgi:alanyl-tRNA synthetase
VTKRLYYLDPNLCTFEASILASRPVDSQAAVVLDATAFYPTGGGQPNDTGTLSDVGGRWRYQVVDVIIDEQGTLWHVLDRPLDPAHKETTARGQIDWDRRFDHMQQHTGQHILSQAFVQIDGIETVSFHLGEQLSTIDLDRAPLDPDTVRMVERRANEIVLSNVEVVASFVDRDELAALPLRKPPAVEGPIRIVQIAAIDWSPCGGTHVQNTGQIGPIKVLRCERRKSETRIYFVCGWRALSDYERKHETVHQLATHMTTSETEIVASVERLEAETKALRKELSATQHRLLDTEIAEWIAHAEKSGERTTMRVIRRAFDKRESALLKEAARRLIERPHTVALLATRQPSPRFVFAQSVDLAEQSRATNMGTLMRSACTLVGGRGGGSATFAQGGAPVGTLVEQVLDHAVSQLGSTDPEGR